MKNSIQNKVFSTICAHRRGWVFTPTDLLRVGSRAAVDQALSRLTTAAKIRRLGRGLYVYPKVHPILGPLTPSADDLARALARSRNLTLHVSGASAANQLGLSTQVPARLVYATDGPTQRVRVGRQTIDFRKASPRRLKGADSPAGTALQALRHLGPDGIDDAVIAKLARALSPDDKRKLGQLVSAAPTWLHPVIAKVTAS